MSGSQVVAGLLAPTAPSTPGYESSLLQVANQARGMSAGYAPVVAKRMADITNTADEEQRTRNTGAVDLAQQMGSQEYSAGGNPATTPFQRAMTRARALSKISLQGELQVRNQSMRDRFSMARFGSNVRSGIASDMNNLAQGQAEANASQMRSQQANNAMYANAFGTLAGSVASLWKNS